MKLFILLSAFLFSVFYPQAQSKSFNLSPSYIQYFHQGDTIRATAQLNVSDGLGTIAWTIDTSSQIKNVAWSTPVVTVSGNIVSSSITILNPVVGSYSLKATATSPTGSTGYLVDQLIVQPAIPIPPQRQATHQVIVMDFVNGKWILTSQALTYNDGTTQ